MSVELSKAIMLASIHVQHTAHTSPPLKTVPSDYITSIYRKCRKRIRALEAVVDELRHEIRMTHKVPHVAAP